MLPVVNKNTSICTKISNVTKCADKCADSPKTDSAKAYSDWLDKK